MSLREYINRFSLVIGQAIIYTLLLFVPISLLTVFISKLLNRSIPAGWLLFLLDFITVVIIILGLAVLRWVKEYLLKHFGVQATATIFESHRCDDNEDACICGYYHYFDKQGREYRFKCKICIHWPSNEQWELVKKGYYQDAVNTVYYLPWFPYTHKIHFPI